MRLVIATASAALLLTLMLPSSPSFSAPGASHLTATGVVTDLSSARKKKVKKKAPKEEYLRAAPMAPEGQKK